MLMQPLGLQKSSLKSANHDPWSRKARHPFKLQIRGTLVPSSGINPVLITNDFPELGTDLVAALSTLNVQDFTHLGDLEPFDKENRKP